MYNYSEYVSMGVMTSGNIYGLPNDINFSLPCTIKHSFFTLLISCVIKFAV